MCYMQITIFLQFVHPHNFSKSSKTGQPWLNSLMGEECVVAVKDIQRDSVKKYVKPVGKRLFGPLHFELTRYYSTHQMDHT